MNQSPTPRRHIVAIPDPNPWDSPQTLPRLHPLGAILLSLLLIAAAAYHPLTTAALSPVYTVLLLVAIAAVLLTLVRSPIVIVVSVLSALAAYIIGGGGGLAGGGLAVATAVLARLLSVGLGGYLFSLLRSWTRYLIPVAAVVLAFVLGAPPLYALLALIPFPAAAILAYATTSQHARVSTICLVSAMYGFCSLFGAAFLWWQSGNPLHAEAIFDAVHALRESITQELLSDAALIDRLRPIYANYDIIPEDAIRSSISLIFTLLPALCITACNLLAYTAQLLCTHTYVGTGMPALATKTARLFFLSVPSAPIYIFVALVTLFSGKMTLFVAACYNLWIVLLPGMLIVGIYKTLADLRSGVGRLWVILLILSILFAPSVLLFCLSLSGALATLVRPLITRRLLQSMSAQDRQDGDDRNDKK